VQHQNAQPATLFVFLFGRIVRRNIRIRPSSLKPLFGTPLMHRNGIIGDGKGETGIDKCTPLEGQFLACPTALSNEYQPA